MLLVGHPLLVAVEPFSLGQGEAALEPRPSHSGGPFPFLDTNSSLQQPAVPVELAPDPAMGSLEYRLAELEEELAESQQRIESLEGTRHQAEKKASTFPNVTINGVFQADGVAFHQTEASREVYGRIESGADFRRARLSAKGAVAPQMDYFLQMDFGFFGRPTFTDVWADFKEAGPLGTVRVGQWKQPFSLEVVSSFRYTTFMERSSLFQAFTPFRHLGIGFYNHAEDLSATWAASYFRTGQDQFGGSLSTDGGHGLAGRLTQLAWYDEVGDDYLHLGGGYFLNAPPKEILRYRSIPEIFVGEFIAPIGQPLGTSGVPVPDVANGTPYFVDTGALLGTSLAQTFGLESLWVRGPLSWQSEAMGSFVDTFTVGNGFLWGAYSQVGLFLTGEYRPYDRKTATIDRVIPKHPFSSPGGLGAWEVAGRWSFTDLSDGPIVGGELQNFTAGLNWYVNPYCKCVFNYIHAWAISRPIRNGVILGDHLIDSQTDAFGIRCQLDF